MNHMPTASVQDDTSSLKAQGLRRSVGFMSATPGDAGTVGGTWSLNLARLAFGCKYIGMRGSVLLVRIGCVVLRQIFLFTVEKIRLFVGYYNSSSRAILLKNDFDVLPPRLAPLSSSPSRYWSQLGPSIRCAHSPVSLCLSFPRLASTHVTDDI